MGLRNMFEKRDVFTDSPADTWDRTFTSLTGLKTFIGKRVTQRSALSMIAVYQCQTLIVDGIAPLPVDVFTKTPDGRRMTATPNASNTWVAQPNPYQTSVEFWTRVIQSLLSDGNAFIATLRNDRGLIVACYVLHPRDVQIKDLPMGEKKYSYMGELYDRSQILHIPALVIGNETRGVSPIDCAREAIGMGLGVEEYGARFFAQGTTMAGIIEHPGVPSKDEAKLLQAMFRKQHAGIKNSHAVGILTGGAAFKPITITPEQAQFLETRRFTKAEIAGLYRVPAYMVDPSLTSTWGTGIEEQNKFLIDYTLMPWAVRIEQAISRFLLPGNQFIKFNFDARLRAKTLERYEAYDKAINAGVMNPDEARALEDLEPIPGGIGKQFWRAANTVPMKRALEKPAPTVAPKPSEPNPPDPNAADPGATDANAPDANTKDVTTNAA